MGMKLLEALVSRLIGEPVELFESEGAGSGIDSQFSFFGVNLYKKTEPKELAPEFHGVDAYVEKPLTAPAAAKKYSVSFHGEEAYTPAPVPKTSSVPAPDPDAEKSAAKGGAEASVEDLLAKNAGLSGAALLQQLTAMGIEIVDLKKQVGIQDPNAPNALEQVNQILMKAPEISAQSLYAAMQASGLSVAEKTQPSESDATTGAAAVLRGKKKESKRSKKYTVTDSHFLEASRDDGVGPTKFKVALIQEGLGNLRDCYYYTRECLESAVATAAFEGRKCFADHPSMTEEQDRPERSVRDIIGHFENVHVEEAEDGSAKLVADLIMPHTQAFEWARTLVSSAIGFAKKYPDRELVGLSINASGDAKNISIDDFMKATKLPESAKPKILKAKDAGATQIRVVSEIKDAISVDLVTEPGARGKILEFIESENKEK